MLYRHIEPIAGGPGVDEASPYRPVSKTNPIPFYHQVESDIRARIESGEWRPGVQIPTEADLCGLYGASRVTIRQAIGKLVAEGLLVRERGRGTFVREPRITAGARGLTSFTEEMAQLGLTAGSQILRLGVEPAPTAIAGRLRIDERAAAVVLKRLRLGDDVPLGLQTTYLPAERFPGLERLELADRSLYATLSARYGVVPTEAEETFEAGPIRGDEARLLGVRPGVAGFHVERLTFDARGPFELVMSVLRGDRYRVRIGLRASH
jgi:GntR family transcriptional regulator